MITFGSNEIAVKALLLADEIKKTRERRVRGALIFNGVCACALAVALVIFYGGGASSYDPFTDGPPPYAAAPAEDERAVPYTGKLCEGNAIFYIPYSEDVVADAGTGNVTMLLNNPCVNSCWLTFTVLLEETGEILYASGLVAPSFCIESFELSRRLLKGAHSAVLAIRAYEPDGLLEMNCANVIFELVAK